MKKCIGKKNPSRLWDGKLNKYWLKVNPNDKKLNSASQEKDTNSTLNYFRKMVKLRKALPELVYVIYELLDKDNVKFTPTQEHLTGKKF